MTQTEEQSVDTQSKSSTERRKATDIWVYAKIGLTIISWVMFLMALVMAYYAAPDTEYGVLRYYDIEVRQFWLTPLTGYLYILLWLSALGSYCALLVDKYRSRRQSDNAHFNLLFLITVNMIWLVFILINIKS
ncbi:hypothetical protein [Colwellia sp. E2M01]|uniref:hypothetical protein n=1 Tax=Colwellia sp. E2M01 TaxID=2841561 RepID=UPI001C08F697|nr:hypothetical protein [Colwellia sp. E2M01]MBU2870561.1 hypothetical protein [Colwellia sp. E2M01]